MTDIAAHAVDEADISTRLDALSLEQRIRLLTGADSWALYPEPAAGLRRVVTSDGPAGVRGEVWDERATSVNVPSPTALAATWDVGLVEEIGRLLAAESRRKGVDVLLAPTVNLHRSPYGGRHFECFSEDPLLASVIGIAYTRGVQGGGVAVTVKHYVANDSETDRLTADVRVGERALRELYLAPFEAICGEGGAWSVMAAYNGVDGATMTESPLLRDILKDEWDWDGLVMSDWMATRSTEAAGAAALDLAMPGPTGPWGDALLAAVRAGRVPEAAIEDKVRRILRLAARVGALDGVAPVAAAPTMPSGEQVVELVRRAATSSFVLARNDGALLPLDAGTLRRVAVLGPNAATARTLGGGSATVYPPYTVSPLAGLTDALGSGTEVVHAVGARTLVRLAAAGAPLARNPVTGAPGVRVRFLAADGSELGTQDRSTGRLLFMGGYVGVDAADVARIEVLTTVTAQEDGEHLVGFSGAGEATVAVDGTQVLHETLTLAAGADPAALLVSPPGSSAPLALTAGQPVSVILRYLPDPASSFIGVSLDVEPPVRSDEDLLQEAVALAASSDVAVVVVGTTEEVESEGFDRTTLALPGRQDELVRAVAQVNPRTVVVVNSGAPVLLPWLADVPAVLLTWFPGQEAGNALADVLLGRAEPGGRLPTTWPAADSHDAAGPLPPVTPVDGILSYDEGLFIGYRRFDRDGVEPTLPFGHGLGWTTWDYDTVTASTTGGGLQVGVTVRNSGPVAGREVVQVYVSRPGSDVERPVRVLAGFTTVTAGPGEQRTVTVDVPARVLEHWDVDRHAWAQDPAPVRVEAGRSSRDLRVSTDLTR